jgi:hypothetical protein
VAQRKEWNGWGKKWGDKKWGDKNESEKSNLHIIICVYNRRSSSFLPKVGQRRPKGQLRPKQNSKHHHYGGGIIVGEKWEDVSESERGRILVERYNRNNK